MQITQLALVVGVDARAARRLAWPKIIGKLKVWVWLPSPEGPFAADNWALP